MKIAIIGAGMSGLACATKLKALGQTPHLFDKGSGPSGRMSTRSLTTPMGEASFDMGAQYFTARDDSFRHAVLDWQRLGVAKLWQSAGKNAYVGTPTMHAPLKHMAAAQNVQWNARVGGLTRERSGWQLHGPGIGPQLFDTVVVAVPAEQAAPLLQPFAPDMAALAAATPSQPCWTVMAAFDRPLLFAADILTETGCIGWAARNNSKPNRLGPEAWVVQAGPEWSNKHLDATQETIAAALLAAFATAAGIQLPQILLQNAHLWRYARAGNAERGSLWNSALGLGACGDWLLGPRVEYAWLSGTQLADAIAASL